MREQTVKAVLTVINKLSDRVVNGELLRFLARTANDEQPGIRTNTTICLGRIAKNLSQGVSWILSCISSTLTSARHAPRFSLLHLQELSEIHSNMQELPVFSPCPLPLTCSPKRTVLGRFFQPSVRRCWIKRSECTTECEQLFFFFTCLWFTD